METQAEPKIIYHYTTKDGLLSILKERALWATKIHYMNDASELIEPSRIAKTRLGNLLSQLDPKSKQIEKQIILRMLDDISEWEQVNICVISFCANGDLLSQWRGYGIPGSAYSLGFDREKLVENIKQYQFELSHCQYFDSNKYQGTIIQFIQEAYTEAVTTKNVPSDFIGKFINMAATMKLECFEEEDEWRIVSWTPVSYNDEKFNFKSSKSMIVPYYSLPIDLDSIVEVIVGPCQHPELTKDAIYGLAHKFNLKNIQGGGNIQISKIPYRVF